MVSGTKTSLPSWLWLWIPIAIVPAQVGVKFASEDLYRSIFRGELGLVENLTVLSLAIAIGCAIWLFRQRDSVDSRWFGPFALVMAAGCFFFAGEEASWGQHWFGYTPPEAIAERNDQGEFNFHNDPFLERILDQPPRAALTLAALIGGVIAPLRRRRQGLGGPRFRSERGDGSGSLQDWIWPTLHCLPACVLVLTVSLPKKIFEATSGETPEALNISPGETKEFGLGLFLMIYLIMLARELAAGRRAAGATGPAGS